MRRLEFKLAKPSLSLNALLALKRGNGHPYRRYQVALAWEISMALVGQRDADPYLHPYLRARLQVDRYSAGILDYDGLIGGLKCLIDCLVIRTKSHPRGLGIIVDDNPACLTTVAASHRVCRADQHTRVIIEELA